MNNTNDNKATPIPNITDLHLNPCFFAFKAKITDPKIETTNSRKKKRTAEYEPP